MILQIPDNISQQLNLTEKELLLELGILFFQKRILSIPKAADLSTVSQKQFKEILSKRNIPFPKELGKKQGSGWHKAGQTVNKGASSTDTALPKSESGDTNKKIATKRLSSVLGFIGTATYPDFPVSKCDVYEQ